MDHGIGDGADPGERRRLVGVDVAAVPRHVARVPAEVVDGEGVALDDGPGQVELRVLVPPAAGVKVGVDGEGEERQPVGDPPVTHGQAFHPPGIVWGCGRYAPTAT